MLQKIINMNLKNGNGRNNMCEFCGTSLDYYLFAIKFWKWLGIPIGIFIFINPGILNYIFFWSSWIYTPDFLEVRTVISIGSCILLSLIIWGWTIFDYFDRRSKK